MRVGLPKEVKDGEFRVALSPAAVASLSNVIVESGAGAGVGFSDEDYLRAGAALGDPWDCELVVKVKELQESEHRKPRPGQTVFSFQHFAPEPRLLDAALASGATFIAFETVGQESGLPILAPMSAIPFIRKIVCNEIDEALASGIQVHAGRVTHAHLARDTGRACSPP